MVAAPELPAAELNVAGDSPRKRLVHREVPQELLGGGSDQLWPLDELAPQVGMLVKVKEREGGE